MAEYNGTIELISGITPKNNGTFPLVNAKDVLMPDGSRLSELNGGYEFSSITLVDDITGNKYVLKVSNGKLTMREVP